MKQRSGKEKTGSPQTKGPRGLQGLSPTKPERAQGPVRAGGRELFSVVVGWDHRRGDMGSRLGAQGGRRHRRRGWRTMRGTL